jgi:2'-5' RNA ligase
VAVSRVQNQIRRQLTLFVQDASGVIESIRKQFNPLQSLLISAHVTLCREDEIEHADKVFQNLKSLKLDFPLKIRFDPVERFDAHKGVWLPGSKDNKQFHELRKFTLEGVINAPRQHRPHLTLMHPRNSTCTDTIFDQIRLHTLPTELSFDEISLIEQRNGGQWTITDVFRIY